MRSWLGRGWAGILEVSPWVTFANPWKFFGLFCDRYDLRKCVVFQCSSRERVFGIVLACCYNLSLCLYRLVNLCIFWYLTNRTYLWRQSPYLLKFAMIYFSEYSLFCPSCLVLLVHDSELVRSFWSDRLQVIIRAIHLGLELRFKAPYLQYQPFWPN